MYKITKPVRLLEIFGGVGSQAMALRDLGVKFEHYRLSDWDVNSCASYKAIHFSDDDTDYSQKRSKDEIIKILYNLGISADGKTPMDEKQISRKGEKWLRSVYNNFRATNNIGSVMNRSGKDLGIVDTDKYEYILTYSFPCQDLSLAGKQAGMSEDSETRSALLWQVKRLLLECKEIGEMPQVLLMENVNAIHNKKNMPDFQKWLDFLESIGYHTYYQDLNSKDYGVAQNRVRTFAISLLSDESYVFPESILLTKRMKDYLEDNVGEEFYINSERAENLIVDLIDRGVLKKKSEGEQQGVDLTTKNPELREISNTIKAGQRGITNFSQDEIGVVENEKTAILRNYGSKFVKFTDVAETQLARNWREFGNQEQSGVIENV